MKVQLALVLENVPVQNDATGHDVRAEDIREWLMFGIQEEDPDVRAAVGRVEVVQAEIEEVKRAMRDVPFLEMFDAHGKPLKDEEADDERAVKYQECSEQKEQFEKKLEQAKLHAQQVIMERDKTPIVLTSPRKKIKPGRATIMARRPGTFLFKRKKPGSSRSGLVASRTGTASN